jgi:hypothetical protein
VITLLIDWCIGWGYTPLFGKKSDHFTLVETLIWDKIVTPFGSDKNRRMVKDLVLPVLIWSAMWIKKHSEKGMHGNKEDASFQQDLAPCNCYLFQVSQHFASSSLYKIISSLGFISNWITCIALSWYVEISALVLRKSLEPIHQETISILSYKKGWNNISFVNMITTWKPKFIFLGVKKTSYFTINLPTKSSFSLVRSEDVLV